jgi:hypothetical protein
MSYLSAHTETSEGWVLDETLREQIHRSVLKDGLSGCWVWNEDRNRQDYGVVKVRSARGTLNRLAHRVSYALFKGPLTPGLVVRHECDNRPCCNPDHLVEGTHQENMQDLAERGPGGNTENLLYEHMLADTSPWTVEMFEEPPRYDIKVIRRAAHEKYKEALRARREQERQKRLEEERLRGFTLKDVRRLERALRRLEKKVQSRDETIVDLKRKLAFARRPRGRKTSPPTSGLQELTFHDAQAIRAAWREETGGCDWRIGPSHLLDDLAGRYRVFTTTIVRVLAGQLYPTAVGVEYSI